MLTQKKDNLDDIVNKHEERDKSLFRKTRTDHGLAYSSRYVRTVTPKHEMPKKSMEAGAAYQIIHDHLILDGNSNQNMATFVTNWMEKEAQHLMIEAMGKNFADKDEYPKTVELQDHCVSMMSKMWNHPYSETNKSSTEKEEKPVGTSCVGSSEAFTLGCLAAKFIWRNRMIKAGKPHDKPNIVFGHNAQICMEKFAKYFDVEPRKIEVSEESNFVTSPEALQKLIREKVINENTIAVVAILGSTFTGHFEDVAGMAAVLDKLEEEEGINIPIHVDAASGGFVAPFVFKNVVWDFKLKRVISINASGHKYGLVYPGVGWIIWRDAKYLPEELIFHIDYLGDDEPTYTINFSRGSSQVVGQYYNFLRLGEEGYKDVISNCIENAKFFSECLEDMGHFILRSGIHKKGATGVPVISFSLKNTDMFDEYILSHELRKYGWIVPAYKLPPKVQHLTIMRVVVRECHSQDFLVDLLKDLEKCIKNLNSFEYPLKTKKDVGHQADIKKENDQKNDSTLFTSVC